MASIFLFIIVEILDVLTILIMIDFPWRYVYPACITKM